MFKFQNKYYNIYHCCKFTHAGLSHLISTFTLVNGSGATKAILRRNNIVQFIFRLLTEHNIQSMLLPSRRVSSTDKLNQKKQTFQICSTLIVFLVFFIQNDNICNKNDNKNAYSWSRLKCLQLKHTELFCNLQKYYPETNKSYH